MIPTETLSSLCFSFNPFFSDLPPRAAPQFFLVFFFISMPRVARLPWSVPGSADGTTQMEACLRHCVHHPAHPRFPLRHQCSIVSIVFHFACCVSSSSNSFLPRYRWGLHLLQWTTHSLVSYLLFHALPSSLSFPLHSRLFVLRASLVSKKSDWKKKKLSEGVREEKKKTCRHGRNG